MFKKSAKRASITSEVSFTILATLAILLLALGMFQDNIKQFIDKGGFPSVWNANAVKTAQENWNIDPTRREAITTPEIQTTSSDAILQNYNTKAQKKIQIYYDIYIANGGNENSLTDGQKINLAMWMAIYANSSTTGNGVVLLSQTPLEDTTYFDFATSPNIGLDLTFMNNYYKIGVPCKSEMKYYDWGADNGNKYSSYGKENNKDGIVEYRVKNIRDENGIVDTFK